MARFKMKVAAHLFLQHEDKLLLLRRYNTGYEDGNYSVVAGHVEKGEEATCAMIREAKEEAGIEIAYPDIRVVQVMHRKKDDERIDFFFACDTWRGEVTNIEPQKCDDLSWFAIDALPSNMVDYVAFAIQQYQQGRFYTTFGWKTPLHA